MAPAFEQCDSGSSNGILCSASYGSSCTYCTSACSIGNIAGPRCGDSIKNGAEACDDGNSNNNDACTTLCALTRCGDAIVQSQNGAGVNEICDDGNSVNNDAC